MALRSNKRDDPPAPEKSWAELASDAAGVAKSVFNKVKDAASGILAPSDAAKGSTGKPARSAPREAPLAPPTGGLFPTLFGRAVGGLLSSALSSLSAQLEAAAREQAGVYEEAVSRLQTSSKLRDRMGTVTVGPVMSQSSSSSSINGVSSKQVTLVLKVYGSLGASGTAQVSAVEGPQKQSRALRITVRTSDGEVINVDEGGPGGIGSGGGRGRIIDVEFKEVK